MLHSRLTTALPALLFATFTGPASPQAPPARSDIERVVRRYYAEVANEADQAKAAAVVDQLLSKDFFFTFGNRDEPSRGIEAHKLFLAGHHRVAAEQVWTIENLVIDSDLAVVRFRLKAVSADAFHGVPGTGKPVATRGIDFFRVSAGRIIELYRVFDVCDFLRQLGVSCPPEPPTVTPRP